MADIWKPDNIPSNTEIYDLVDKAFTPKTDGCKFCGGKTIGYREYCGAQCEVRTALATLKRRRQK